MSRAVKTRLFALLSAIIYFILGVLLLTRPGATLVSLIIILGILLILIGIFLVIDGVSLPELSSYKVPYILDGVLAFLLGLVFVLGNAYVNISVLAYMLVIWMMVSSFIQIYLAWPLGMWARIFAILLCILVVILSVFALLDPTLAQGLLVWYLAYQFILLGMIRLVIALDPDTGRAEREQDDERPMREEVIMEEEIVAKTDKPKKVEKAKKVDKSKKVDTAKKEISGKKTATPKKAQTTKRAKTTTKKDKK